MKQFNCNFSSQNNSILTHKIFVFQQHSVDKQMKSIEMPHCIFCLPNIRYSLKKYDLILTSQHVLAAVHNNTNKQIGQLLQRLCDCCNVIAIKLHEIMQNKGYYTIHGNR